MTEMALSLVRNERGAISFQRGIIIEEGSVAEWLGRRNPAVAGLRWGSTLRPFFRHVTWV